MIDNLHFFKDIRIGKSRKGARFLSFYQDFANAAGNNKILFLSFLISSVFLSISLMKLICSLLAMPFSFLQLFFIFELSLIMLCWVCLEVSKRIAFRFKCRLDTGIRDSWFLMSGINMFAIYLFPLFSEIPVKGFLVAGAAAIVATGLLSLFYEKRIAVKKQPDLDVPYLFEPDGPSDFEALGNAELQKIQINGDSRDAFTMRAGEEIELKLPGEAARIKFAIGVRESSKTRGNKSAIIKVSEKIDSSEEKLIYSRLLEQLPNKNERSWTEVALDLEPQASSQYRPITVKVETVGKNVSGNNEKIYCFSGPKISGKPNPRKVILIVVDALRPDHVGCYGYQRPVSPNIDKLAKDSVRFELAFGQGQWTLPAFMSILTGMYPSSHHVYHHYSYHTLGKEVLTLPEVLRKNGFTTRCFFTHKRLMSHFGFARGFDSHLFRQCNKEWNIGTADDVTDRAFDMLGFHKDDDLFLMLHYFDTHQPCDPPAPFSELFDKTYDQKVVKDVKRTLKDRGKTALDEKDLNNLIARYDAEILRADMKIGTILDYLKKTGQYDESMIVITADHGMSLNEHGSLTDFSLFDETVKVPLVVKFPESSGAPKGTCVKDDIVEAGIDIMPTILQTYGINIPGTVQGESVIPLAKNHTNVPSDGRKAHAFSESLFGNVYSISLRNPSHRYIFTTKFDISEFKNYSNLNAEESVFKASNTSPEMDIGPSDGQPLMDKYKTTVERYIAETLKIHNKKEGR